MTEQRQIYSINAAQDVADIERQINLQFAALADRLDQMEGYRGTPTFRGIHGNHGHA